MMNINKASKKDSQIILLKKNIHKTSKEIANHENIKEMWNEIFFFNYFIIFKTLQIIIKYETLVKEKLTELNHKT